MKLFSLFMFNIIIFYSTPVSCMQKKPLPIRHYKVSTNEKIIINFLKQSDFFLKNISPDKSYTLEELHNWFIPLSMVNKKVYDTATKASFSRAVISSVAFNNDHYNEGDIAQVLNTPGTRCYMKLSSQLFNSNFTDQEIRILIKQGADINYRKQYHAGGDTPLLHAIRQQSFGRVHQLLRAGAPLHHYTSIDPISLSITIENLKIFKTLMPYYNPAKHTLYHPLRYAIKKYAETAHQSLQETYKTIIRTLLIKKADATEGLIYAIGQGYFHPFLIGIFVKEYHADPNEAFIELTNYTLNNTSANKEHIEHAIKILTQSFLFKKEQNTDFLLQSAKRINTLNVWINPQEGQ